jgi:PAS domain S-box-containing protein
MSSEDSVYPGPALRAELFSLLEQLERFRNGEWEGDLQLHSDNPELRKMESVLNGIFDAWRRQQLKFRQKIQHLELELFKHDALINNIPDIAWFKDINSIYTIANEAIAKASGHSTEYLTGKNDFDFWPSEFAAQYRADDQHVMKTGKRYQVEEHFVGVDGLLQWVETIKTPVWDQAGNIIGTVGIARDITQRKQMEEENRQLTLDLEKRVQERTAELQKVNHALHRSNQDLESFATIASHDLQNPLRKVMVFSEHLKASASEKLNAEELDDLNRLQLSVQKMQSLIDDLLALSRVTRRGKPFQKTDLQQVLSEALAELRYTIQETKGVIHVAKLPTIEVDPDQIRQMLMQLIENGLRFHQEEQEPVLSISSVMLKDTGLCKILIHDNGIGIAEENHQKIFEPFVHLHSIQKYPGSGIGLTLAQKIAERHGGKIELESKPGDGSTFFVTLPVTH